MNSSWRFALLFVVTTSIAPASAQQTPADHRQVVSANPFGLLAEFFNAEYERRVSPSTTAGVGGSMFPGAGDDYVNADVFFRYYPAGRALEGLTVGVKVGVTNVDSRKFFGYGFDLNHSRLMGTSQKFYIGWGFGLKRLVGADEYNQFVPTIRLVNVGVAF